MLKHRPKILVFSSPYLPGIKGGGPIRTIASLVEALGDEFDFSIVTQDRDLGDRTPYPDIRSNIWQQHRKSRVYYVSPSELTWSFLHRIIVDTPHDILYLNSFFSIYFGILPLLYRRMGLLPNKPIIVAPRGQFSFSALQFKSLKKKIFIWFFRALRLHASLLWQVSSLNEKDDLLRVFAVRHDHPRLKFFVAPNLPNIVPLSIKQTRRKEPGNLKIIFLSRLSPMKNLEWAIKCLAGLNGTVQFNIYGPIEDAAYWENCQRLIRQLPGNIQVFYRGMVAHEYVLQTMAEHDLFFLPTLGENYGHVIIEALAVGCPVLISDKTPWCELEKKGVGWDIPLDQPERFKAVLQHCVDMSYEDMAGYFSRTRAFAGRTIRDSQAIQQNRDLFLHLL